MDNVNHQSMMSSIHTLYSYNNNSMQLSSEDCMVLNTDNLNGSKLRMSCVILWPYICHSINLKYYVHCFCTLLSRKSQFLTTIICTITKIDIEVATCAVLLFKYYPMALQ